MAITKVGGVIVETPITNDDRFGRTGVMDDVSFAVCNIIDVTKQIKLDPGPQSSGGNVIFRAGVSSGTVVLTLPTSSGTLATGGGGGSNSFTIMQPDAGTAPTAVTGADTLTLTGGAAAQILVTGNSGTDTLTFTTPDNKSAQQVIVAKAGSTIGTRHKINLIEGTNVTLTVADNSGADRVDVTINSSGSGGGSITPPGTTTNRAISTWNGTAGAALFDNPLATIDSSGNIAANNLSGTNTGDITLTAVGAAPSANAATLSGQALTIQPADATHPGVVTSGTQTFGGAKTFPAPLTVSGSNTSAVVINTAAFVFDSTNAALGINNASPSTTTFIDAINSTGAAKRLLLTGYGTGSFVGARGRFARGTSGTPAAAQTGDVLSFISGQGYGTTTFPATSTGVMNIVAGATFTDSSMPTYQTFSVTPSASVTAAEAVRINSTGNVLIGTTTDNATDKLQVNGTLSATNVSGTNTGDVSLAAVGSSPSANGASLAGQVLTLQPADGTHSGLVSTTTQTFGGNKTFSGNITSLSETVSGTAGAGFVLIPAQSATPATPASGISVYANATGMKSWVGTNGFVRTLDGTITASRVYNLPDVSANIQSDALLYGDGSAGNVTISSGTTTLTQDTYYNNLTLSGTGILAAAGYRIFVAGTLDITAAPAGAIKLNGSNGNTSVGSAGGTGGNSAAGVTLGVASTGGTGATAVTTNGVTAATPSAIAANGGNGGTAGASGAGTSGTTAAGRAFAANLILPFRRIDYNLQRGVTLIAGGGAGPGGSGGGGDGANTGGGGGGGGGFAGVIGIWANTISRGGSTVASAIQAIGGNGGNGRTQPTGTVGGGGGGAGGGGGWVYIVYNTLTGSTATGCIDVTAGGGGAGGNGVGAGGNGGAGGGTGVSGRVTLISVSTGVITETVNAQATTAGNAASGATGGGTQAATAAKVDL